MRSRLSALARFTEVPFSSIMAVDARRVVLAMVALLTGERDRRATDLGQALEF